jgi:hypothetical protein
MAESFSIVCERTERADERLGGITSRAGVIARGARSAAAIRPQCARDRAQRAITLLEPRAAC